ncbi:MAG: SEC-C domain-containing protein [Proteobacteria bacterium]|nr:SEC-C domain-containing protein [Pseudomonadota bacterium]
MNNQQRNAPCHCGSGKKYKVCCMRKDEAQAQLSRQQYDVRRVIGPGTSPYIFWKRWSAACSRNEFGLVYDMLLAGGELSERFKTAEDFFVNLSEIGLPYEPVWSLDKIKLTETLCMFLCHRVDDEDKNADNIVSLVTLKRTESGLRVENVRKVVEKASPDFQLSFELFGIESAEHAYLLKCQTGWTRPDLTDESSRFVAPEV